MPSLLGGATYTHGGTFTTGNSVDSNVIVKLVNANEAWLDNPMDGFLAQQVNANVTTQDRTVYEIGTNKYYRIQGRPSGSGTIQHLVGPNKKAVWRSLDKWTGCKPYSLQVNVKPSKDKCPESTAVGSDGAVYFTGGFLNSINIGVTAGEVMATSNLGFTFMDLSTEP